MLPTRNHIEPYFVGKSYCFSAFTGSLFFLPGRDLLWRVPYANRTCGP
jgi:hypothetical protein